MDLYKRAMEVARQYGIPEGIFLGLIEAESSWNPNAVSVAGAIGLTQIMPSTAKLLGYNPQKLKYDPELQLEAGAKYLKDMYDEFQCWEEALAAYNAGPHNVKKYYGVPPFPETERYVQKVMALAEKYQKEISKGKKKQKQTAKFENKKTVISKFKRK